MGQDQNTVNCYFLSWTGNVSLIRWHLSKDWKKWRDKRYKYLRIFQTEKPASAKSLRRKCTWCLSRNNKETVWVEQKGSSGDLGYCFWIGSHLRDLHRKPKLQSIFGFKGSRRIPGEWKNEVLHKQKRWRVINKTRITMNKVNMSEGQGKR